MRMPKTPRPRTSARCAGPAEAALADANERSEDNFCSMKITQDVRDFAAKHGVSDADALKKGMEVKAVEFVKQGAEIYSKA